MSDDMHAVGRQTGAARTPSVVYAAPKTLRRRFHEQRWNASARGIGWDLTFDQWLAIWVASGRLEERGRGDGKYCMARHGDVGPYRADNVSIKTCNENGQESEKYRLVGGFANRRDTRGKGRGWTLTSNSKNPFAVAYCNKYVGMFPTQEQAEEAYRRVHNESMAHARQLKALLKAAGVAP